MTTKFKKDYNKMRSRNNFDENEFKIVIELLSNGELLPENIIIIYQSQNQIGLWECHIKPDWLLIYKKSDDALILVLTRTGTHSDLFK